MAKADRKHFGAGAQGKGDGTGAMSELDDDKVRKNDILSNRDKVQLSTDQRGHDSSYVQSQEYKDHSGSRRKPDET